MSRYPFKECVNEVLPLYEDARSKRTVEVMKRRFNRMERELSELKSRSLIKTTNPKTLTPNDIEVYYEFLKTKKGIDGKNIDIESIKKDFIELDKLCKFYGNNCVDVFRVRHPMLTKGRSKKRLPCMSEDELQKIVLAAETIPNDNFSMIRAFALVGLYIGAGLRTIEVQHALESNLAIKSNEEAEIFLEIVKGIETYGQERTAIILPMFVPMIVRYMMSRLDYLNENFQYTDYVFFSMDDFEKLSDKTIRQIRNKVEAYIGIKFDGRKCRRTYGQYLSDHEVEIEDISVVMGHNSTKTTERYYARKKSDKAIKSIRKNFV